VCNGYTGWEDLSITGSYPAYSASDSQINRVRFTRAVRVRLYENMARHDGLNPLGAACFGFPNFNDPGYANTVWGYVMNVPLPGPTDAALCPAPGTWMPGGGVYSRLIDPSAP
jgi:hypothetical protein